MWVTPGGRGQNSPKIYRMPHARPLNIEKVLLSRIFLEFLRSRIPIQSLSYYTYSLQIHMFLQDKKRSRDSAPPIGFQFFWSERFYFWRLGQAQTKIRQVQSCLFLSLEKKSLAEGARLLFLTLFLTAHRSGRFFSLLLPIVENFQVPT